MKLLREIDVSGKKVFLRGDLDVSMADVANSKFEIRNSKLSEASVRLQNLKPTVDYLLEHGARQIVIAGHVGRPKQLTVDPSTKLRASSSQLTVNLNKPKYFDEELSTRHLVKPLENLLGQKVTFFPDVILIPPLAGEESQNRSFVESDSTQDDHESDSIGVGPLIVLLENLRFWEGEEKNDPEFAKILASLADVYVNDAFGVCHRNHASIAGVPRILPHAAGLHLEEEVNELTKLIKSPQRPLVAIIGGAKLETKIPMIEAMAKVADFVLVGGELIHQIEDLASQGEALQGYEIKVIVARSTPDGKDIDNVSMTRFVDTIKKAKTIVWNGPMGLFEEGFEAGTMAIAEAVIQSGSYSVVGGGETTEFLVLKNLLGKFSFVSSGGGAMLEYLSGNKLPGIEALE